jgi:hypothetical protein
MLGRTAQQLLDAPAVPFHEEAAARALLVTLGDRARLDPFGNVAIDPPSADGPFADGDPDVPFCLAAGLDAPGFEVLAVAGDRAEAAWYGPADPTRLESTPLVVHGAHGPVGAGISSMTVTDGPGGPRPDRLLLNVDGGRTHVGEFGGPAPAGLTRRDGWLVAHGLRARIGSAAVVDTLSASDAPLVRGLLTRAAQCDAAGLAGALGAGGASFAGRSALHVFGIPPQSGFEPGCGPALVVAVGADTLDAAVSRFVQGIALEAEIPLRILCAEAVHGEVALWAAGGPPAAAVCVACPDVDERTAAIPASACRVDDHARLVTLLTAIVRAWPGANTVQAAWREHARSLLEAARTHVRRLEPWSP